MMHQVSDTTPSHGSAHGRGTSSKSSLRFIMNDPEPEVTQQSTHARSFEVFGLPNGLIVIAPAASWTPCDLIRTLRQPPARIATRAATAEEKRTRTRTCTAEGCNNFIINRGLCFRHGGGRKCSVTGCESSAKSRGLCWRHGGSAKCSIEGCERRSKSRGLCWTHGGGTRCSNTSCAKVAVSNGFCWAHGGGKRCAYSGCRRAAYERNHNYCDRHYLQLKDGNETVEL